MPQEPRNNRLEREEPASMNSPLSKLNPMWTTTKKSARVLSAALVVFLACASLFSQGSQGTIQGGVFDQSGGAVAGAMVTVTDVARGITRDLIADDAGQYVATNLNPGTYTVRATAKGFQTEEHSGVLVEVGQNIRVDMVLHTGEQAQTITVSGEVPAIDSTDATLGGTVSNDSILALPLNGRNFQRLLQLRPGIVTSPGAGSGASSTNGLRAGDDLLVVEGIIQLGQSSSTSLMNAVYHGGDSTSILPIDAIQEFNEEQNPKAEFGWKDGSVISVGVKSGTNSLHGTAYAFGRDASATDAANYFSSPGVPGVTPATLEQFGATAGGSIVKDKLFWFASFEGLREQVGDVSVDTIPSDVAGLGASKSLVDACLALGPAKISALSAQISGLNPTTCVVSPSSNTNENLWPYLASATSTNFSPALISSGPLNNGLAKIDYVPGPHQHFSGVFFDSQADQIQNASTGQLLARWENNDVLLLRMYDGDWTWTPNSTWVTDTRFGYVYIRNENIPEDASVIPSNPWPSGYGMNTGVTNPVYGGMPEIQISGFTGFLGGGTRDAVRGPQGNIDLTEGVSYLRGKHSFKFGFEYVDIVFDTAQFSQSQGDIKFKSKGSTTALENYLEGIPGSGTILLGGSPSTNLSDHLQYYRSHWYAGYVQDDWRLSTKITLNLGIRYEITSPPAERDNYFGNFNPNVNPATTPAIEQVGPGAPINSLYNVDHKEISPRAGIAWDVRGDGKTVVRAGASILNVPAIMGALANIAPFGATFIGNSGLIGSNMSGTAANVATLFQPSLTGCNASTCSNGLNWTVAGPIFPTTASTGGATCSPTAPCTTGGTEPNFRQAHAAEWNLDVQRAVTNNLTLDVAYVGNHGFDGQLSEDVNQAPFGAGYTPAVKTACLAAPSAITCAPNESAIMAAEPYQSVFPYLNFINLTTNGAYSNYDSLQLTVNERLSHGLRFLAGYTFAHALDLLYSDNTGGALVPTDNANLRADYGNSANDLRHRFTFSPSYALPDIKSPGQMLQGWEVSGIVVLQDGLPWSPNDVTDDFLGTNEINNSFGGTLTAWNYSGPTSAFTAGPHPIPCFGSMAGCTPYMGGVPPTVCSNAAMAAYPGNPQLQQLALASLTNFGCYVQNGGVMTPPAYGTNGNAPRNGFRYANYYNVDMSIAKNWKFTERYTAQFRVEFFNLFNRADFGTASGVGAPNAFDPSAGSGGQFGCACTTPDALNPVLGSGGPRHIQFGLKLGF
jgi:hypothetical protein